RRDLSPPGRLRRILFEHRSGVWALVGTATLLLVLFVSTTALAVNERFKRDVSQMAYSRDLRGLQFLLQKEAEVLEQMSDTVAALETRVDAATPQQQPYLVVSIEERRV